MADSDRNSGRWEGKEMFGLLLEMAGLMNTGLDTQTLALCVRLIEEGASYVVFINPLAKSFMLNFYNSHLQNRPLHKEKKNVNFNYILN
ncbi:hypothetical protein AVEN_240744-1 [Araneus ventricosus]|uniref:Uncharacterized protein n=1 Tax=Araneus ventricosus TaxID=182803 RepID=A0A4Y2PXU9_ARAVE|nr:hypothetical protein AVEN_240744-1 [Araneus ventricosus]